MKKRFENNKAQMEMGYGMIFSIFLIVIFIVVAFIAIKAFLGTSCTTETGQFLKDLQSNVDEIWSGAGVENFTFRRTLQGNCGLEYVCLYNVDEGLTGKSTKLAVDFKERTSEDGTKNNLYLYPSRKAKIPSIYLKHINMDRLNENPHCIKIENNLVEIKLSKGLKEALVSVD